MENPMQPEEQKPKAPFRLWVFVFAGILAMTILFISVDARNFTPHYTLHVYLRNVEGLEKNAPVRLDGMDVGWVREVRFGPRDASGKFDPEKNFDIEIRILKKFQEEIRSDSLASLVAEGLLGQTTVHVTRGSSTEILRDSGVLAGQEAKVVRLGDFMDRLSDIAICVEELKKHGKPEKDEKSVSGATKEE